MIRQDSERPKPVKPLPPIPTSNGSATSQVQMLQDIKENLNFLRRDNVHHPNLGLNSSSQSYPLTINCPKPESMQIRPDVASNNVSALQQQFPPGGNNVGPLPSPSSDSSRSLKSSRQYTQNALEQIRNSLLPFAAAQASNDWAGSTNSEPSSGTPSECGGSVSSSSSFGINNGQRSAVQQFLNSYNEDLARSIRPYGKDELTPKCPEHRMGGALKVEHINGLNKTGKNILNLRKSCDNSWERAGSIADSSNGSIRSDSPCLTGLQSQIQTDPSRLMNGQHDLLSKQSSLPFSRASAEPPPIPPPRGVIASPPPITPPPRSNSSQTPPPLPPPVSQQPSYYNSQMQQYLKRKSPIPQGSRPQAVSYTSSSSRVPLALANSTHIQQQLAQQLQSLSIYPTRSEALPPPYPNSSMSSYSSSSGRHSPLSTCSDYRSTPPPAYIPSPSPSSMNAQQCPPRPIPPKAWGARQAKSQSPVIMQSVKSTQVQKPVLQTAIAPPAPQLCTPVTVPNTNPAPPPPSSVPSSVSSIPQRPAPEPPPPPPYQNKNPPLYPRGQHIQPPEPPPYPHPSLNGIATPPPPLPPYPSENVPPPPPYHKAPPPPIPEPRPPQSRPPPIPTTDPPSYASSMVAIAAQQRAAPSAAVVPSSTSGTCNLVNTVESICTSQVTALPGAFDPIYNGHHAPVQRKSSVTLDSGSLPSRSGSPVSFLSTTSSPSTQSDCTQDSGRGSSIPPYKTTHQSPIPVRKVLSKEKEEERRETKVKNYSSAAFKFFMEQHIENLLKSHQQRERRRQQLETEMTKVGLSQEAQYQMRKMLHQKESNYIRLKRAKMEKSMFVRIKTIGIGAFGEVSLVRKLDTTQLYAMKTLRKDDVLKRNQVAHVKAERDILAEADNEWVVKLYYSFQDKDNLYFVMDYIPGGDLMTLLIKLGIFEEQLARFYIAELVLAVESVHKMGFIHRDIKPDNILIDKDGHIKLTDFGLCTGFRWTHNSKYYQRNGDHARQDSMDMDENWSNECRCKPLERRRRREHQRCLAHSLVGTPNYMAPEVLLRRGYTHVCDWWSVGVILYEMLVGQPPFLANSPAETQHKVINWETQFLIPLNANLSHEATDLLIKWCCKSENRLGKNGTDEIKSHPFFKSIVLESTVRKEIAPYIPEIRHPMDTSNFDTIEDNSFPTGCPDPQDDPEENGGPEHAFFEFTFRRFFDDGGHACPLRITLDESEANPVYV